MYVYVCICMYMYAYVCMYMYVYIYVYIHLQLYYICTKVDRGSHLTRVKVDVQFPFFFGQQLQFTILLPVAGKDTDPNAISDEIVEEVVEFLVKKETVAVQSYLCVSFGLGSIEALCASIHNIYCQRVRSRGPYWFSGCAPV